MNETEGFLRKYRGKGAFLDANLLLVYAVGRYDRRRLGTFHHTKQFEEDFEWIERLVLRWFSKIHTTPNILTEVSNLGGKLGSSFFDQLKTVIAPLVEMHCPSVTGTNDNKFREVGPTASFSPSPPRIRASCSLPTSICITFFERDTSMRSTLIIYGRYAGKWDRAKCIDAGSLKPAAKKRTLDLYENSRRRGRKTNCRFSI